MCYSASVACSSCCATEERGRCKKADTAPPKDFRSHVTTNSKTNHTTQPIHSQDGMILTPPPGAESAARITSSTSTAFPKAATNHRHYVCSAVAPSRLLSSPDPTPTINYKMTLFTIYPSPVSILQPSLTPISGVSLTMRQRYNYTSLSSPISIGFFFTA